MKRKAKFLLFLFLLLLIGGCEEVDSVQNHVEQFYENDEGLIHAYPQDQDSEYLSESIGLYLEYLLLIEDQKAFQKQVENLKNHFLIKQHDFLFVQWRLNHNATTNALIDDVRIISVLERAAHHFGIEDYNDLAEELSSTIANTQKVEDYTVDFYDWTLSLPAQRLTLSYLNKAHLVSKSSISLLQTTEGSKIFFPEYYDTRLHEYIQNEEVHMIDQLLIAINREQAGVPSMLFLDWVKKEWSSTHKLYGRYNRETQNSAVDYESLAVYYYLSFYFSLMNEEKLALEVVKHAKEIATEDMLEQAHFFDYIHYQMMIHEY